MSQLIVNPETRTLRALLGNSIRYEVPRFQRNYAWDKEQWSELWEDIHALQEKQQHYMGYIVLQERSTREFVIVDGQQRIVTLCILALAVAHFMKNEKRRDRLLHSYLYAESVAELIPKPRITLNRINDAFYRQKLLEKNSPVSMQRQHISNKKMYQAYQFFQNKIAEAFTGKSDDEAAQFFDIRVGDGLIFTVLNVQDDGAAFIIFETLNARGVELSSPDLLKNHLFSVVYEGYRTEDTLKEIESRWQSVSDTLASQNMTTFLKHYWNSKNEGPIRKNNLYKSIRENLDTAEKVFPFLTEMNDAAEIYSEMRKPETGRWEPEQKKYLSELSLYKSSLFYPLLLAAYREWGKGREFTKVIRYCSVIIFRHCVVGELNPNDLEGAFARACTAVRDGAQTAAELLPCLKPVYLGDERFKSAFTDLTFSPSGKKLAHYILLSIESGKTGTDYLGTSGKYTLEHIFPENSGDGWDEFGVGEKDVFLWNIGNLTLLDAKENRQVANKPFEEKRSVYQASRFQITKECAGYDQWSPAIINQRRQKLGKTVCGIWSINFP